MEIQPHLSHQSQPSSDTRSDCQGVFSAIDLQKQRRTAPAGIVTAFSNFRARKKENISAPSPIRRKPLPPTASPIISKFEGDSFRQGGPVGIPRVPRSSSVQLMISSHSALPSSPEDSPPFDPRNLEKSRHRQSSSPFLVHAEGENFSFPDPSNAVLPISVARARYSSGQQSTFDVDSSILEKEDDRMPRTASKSKKQDPERRTTLKADVDPSALPKRQGSGDSRRSTKTSKGGGRFTSFFWGSKNAESPSAEPYPIDISDADGSNVASPLDDSPQTSSPSGRSIPSDADFTKLRSSRHGYSYSHISSDRDTMMIDEDVEGELREVSAELVSSIKRELDLEDLVERLQTQLDACQIPDSNKRTSDYYSDSGASSVTGFYRFPVNDYGVKLDELEKLKRDSEQQVAQIKIDLLNKLQEERLKKQELEVQIQSLQGQLQEQHERGDYGDDSSGPKVKELETTLEDVKRRLVEEKQMKENFEDLLSALKEQLEEQRNERDRLRDDLVPDLRNQVEHLEKEAANSKKLSSELSKLREDMQALRNENDALANLKRASILQKHESRFNSIAEEEGGLPVKPAIGLSRSNSLARNPRNSLARSQSLRRSSTIMDKNKPAHESLADRIKDVEAQRDALHRSLKLLLERHKLRERENAKQIAQLEMERDRAMNVGSPRKLGYTREVKHLREEVNHLRKRADEALEQKWQCEKGLGGLKIDLDRAEQETSYLRSLLQEHDILVPGRLSQEIQVGDQFTSESLEAAFKELQITQNESIARMKDMGVSMSHADGGQEPSAADGSAGTGASLEEEQKLADQLRGSAERVSELAIQVRQQLDVNAALRRRLSQAVERGERAQNESTSRINDLQTKLKIYEDRVLAAQQSSEDAVIRHEDEIRELKKAQNEQLQRMKTGVKSPSFSPRSPMSPMFLSKSPKLEFTTTGFAKTLDQVTKTEFLQKKVGELEKALSEADREMQEVVSRMNIAQIEVMELQNDRDEAIRKSRRLQEQVTAEQAKVQALLSGSK